MRPIPFVPSSNYQLKSAAFLISSGARYSPPPPPPLLLFHRLQIAGVCPVCPDSFQSLLSSMMSSLPPLPSTFPPFPPDCFPLKRMAFVLLSLKHWPHQIGFLMNTLFFFYLSSPLFSYTLPYQLTLRLNQSNAINYCLINRILLLVSQ